MMTMPLLVPTRRKNWEDLLLILCVLWLKVYLSSRESGQTDERNNIDNNEETDELGLQRNRFS